VPVCVSAVCVCVTTTHVHCIGVEVLLQLARQPEMKSKSNELPLSSCCKCVLHQREPVRAGAFSSSSLFVLILLFRPPTWPPLASPRHSHASPVAVFEYLYLLPCNNVTCNWRHFHL